MRGMQLIAAHKRGEALQQFNLALKKDPNYGDALEQRALFYCSIGQGVKALDDCNKLIAMDPAGKKHKNAYLYRSMAYNQMEEPQKALDDANKALALGCPDLMSIHDVRYVCSRNLNRIDDAMQALNAILALPVQPEFRYRRLYQRSELYQAKGQYDKALVDLKAALAVNPKYDGCYQRMADIHKKMNHPELAIQDYDALLKISGDDELVLMLRGQAKTSAGRYADAVADFDRAIKLTSTPSPRMYDARAAAYAKMGRADLAAKDRALAEKFRSEP